MKKIRLSIKICVFVSLVFFACGLSAVQGSEEDGKWDKAAEEIKEAAVAVKDAAKDTSKKAWQKTREESGEIYGQAKEESGGIWDKTKKISKETWEDVKEGSEEAWEYTREESMEIFERARTKIHEVTAPEPNGEPDPE